MTINITVPKDDLSLKPRITVIGVGGAGGNAVNNMIQSNLHGVDFIVANTDAQALELSHADQRIQLGQTVTQGLGAGSKPDVGRAAAEEAISQIMAKLEDQNMVFITAGMGGGTGTGAAPVVAQACRESGILTVGVVTKPFHFEGRHRMNTAEAGIEELQRYVDTLIIIPNQNLFRVANDKTTFADAFNMADDVLHSGVRGVTDLMVMPGLINLDFADIRSVMSEMGKAMMGTGEATGDTRAVDAAEAAINNPLLEDSSMKGARGVLINITGGHDMTLYEVDEAANRIRDEVDPEANIIFGSTFDERLEGVMRVSVVSTGIAAEGAAAVPPARPALSVIRARADDQPKSADKTAGAVTGTVAALTEAGMAEATMAGVVDEGQLDLEGTAAATPAQIFESYTAGDGQPQDAAETLAETLADTLAEAAPADTVFIPAAPVMPPAAEKATTPVAPTGPLQADTAIEAPSPAETPKRNNLFRQITRIGLVAKNEPSKPTVAKEPAITPAPSQTVPSSGSGEDDGQARLGGLDAAGETDDGLLDIPAFLRRQAN